jgi:hypothetical protein
MKQCCGSGSVYSMELLDPYPEAKKLLKFRKINKQNFFENLDLGAVPTENNKPKILDGSGSVSKCHGSFHI